MWCYLLTFLTFYSVHRCFWFVSEPHVGQCNSKGHLDMESKSTRLVLITWMLAYQFLHCSASDKNFKEPKDVSIHVATDDICLSCKSGSMF